MEVLNQNSEIKTLDFSGLKKESEITDKLGDKVGQEKKKENNGEKLVVKQGGPLIDLESENDSDEKLVLHLQEQCALLLELMETKEKKFEETISELRNELLEQIKVLKKEQAEKEKELEKLRSKKEADKDASKNQVAAVKDVETLKTTRPYDSWLKNGVFELEKWFLLQGEQLNTFIFQKNYWTNPPDFVWKMTSMKKTMAKKTWSFTSADFNLNGYLFKGRCKIEGKDEDKIVSLKLSFRSFMNTGQVIPFRLVPAVHYIIKQSDGEQDGSSDMTMSAWSFFQEEILYGKKYFEVNFKKDILNNPRYNANDSLSIEIHVEPPSMARHVYAYDGSVTWAVEGFKMSKELEANGLNQCHTGPYFYTSPRGYRIRFRLYLNGKGENAGKGITAEIAFLTGDFDASLPKAFPHKTSVTIFNTKDPKKYKTESIKEDIVKYSSYSFQVMTNEDLNKYVCGDTLVYKVAIDEM